VYSILTLESTRSRHLIRGTLAPECYRVAWLVITRTAWGEMILWSRVLVPHAAVLTARQDISVLVSSNDFGQCGIRTPKIERPSRRKRCETQQMYISGQSEDIQRTEGVARFLVLLQLWRGNCMAKCGVFGIDWAKVSQVVGNLPPSLCWNSIAADTYKHIECVMLRNKGRTPDVSDERNPLGPCMDGAGLSLPIVLLRASGCEKWWDSMWQNLRSFSA